MNEVISYCIDRMKNVVTYDELRELYECAKNTFVNDMTIPIDDYHEMRTVFLTRVSELYINN